MITALADQLIDAWIDRDDGDGWGTVEFIEEFARPLPQMVMASVLGFPAEDLPRLAAWGSAQVMQFVQGQGHLNQLSKEQERLQAAIDAAMRPDRVENRVTTTRIEIGADPEKAKKRYLEQINAKYVKK